MFQPKYIKNARLLHKGVVKFQHYKRDVLSREKLDGIAAANDRLKGAIKERDLEACEKAATEVSEACEKAFPTPGNPVLRENVEVLFVAVVIALGIRTFFLQPFSIPTGSMQPTLNGIVATEVGEWGEGESPGKPNLISRAWNIVWAGRGFVDVSAPKGGRLRMSECITETTFLKFFKTTNVHLEDGSRIKVHTGMKNALASLGLARNLGVNVRSNHRGELEVYHNGAEVEKGQLLARGYVTTGDKVLVDKFSYHFRTPKRDEVFVFTTKGIRGIEGGGGFDERFGSQHYIKRLVAVPGDEIRVESPNLYINGELAEGEGSRRVMAMEGDYAGYGPGPKLTLREKEYYAMGDNSYNSFDSRGWGPVPEANLVGPAFGVYWPFAHHFGKIR